MAEIISFPDRPSFTEHTMDSREKELLEHLRAIVGGTKVRDQDMQAANDARWSRGSPKSPHGQRRTNRV